MSVEQRLQKAREIPGETEVNCLSLVLFLLGITSEERYVSPWDSRLEEAAEVVGTMSATGEITIPPVANVIGVWHKDMQQYDHYAFIDTPSGLVIERNEYGAAVRVLSPVEFRSNFHSFMKPYIGPVYEVRYLFVDPDLEW